MFQISPKLDEEEMLCDREKLTSDPQLRGQANANDLGTGTRPFRIDQPTTVTSAPIAGHGPW